MSRLGSFRGGAIPTARQISRSGDGEEAGRWRRGGVGSKNFPPCAQESEKIWESLHPDAHSDLDVRRIYFTARDHLVADRVVRVL